LKFVFDRCDGNGDVIDTPIGKLPVPGSLDIDGLKIDAADLEALLTVDSDGWKQAVPQIREHFARFGDKLPDELIAAVDKLESSLA
ncbi:MAG: phosphoenolpyruvate carboxykinase (GTP), partial [Ilumatobacter sp.]|nr:phosphoenolpyruvate carboxykinase (GTP) [Ilumatobacter sp.]